MTSLTSAIVGSGLVLARVLEIHGIQSTIYELDVSADARIQSGILHLHKVSGQRATREVGLYEQFRRLVAGAVTAPGTCTQRWSDFGLKTGFIK